MKFIKKLLILIVCFIYCSGCTQSTDRAPYALYADKIIDAFIIAMRKEYNLICTGRGGSMPYDVESFNFIFTAYKNASIEEARALEIHAVEKLIAMVNANEKIRPFLREYPFPPERAYISISFEDKENKYYSNGAVAYISQAHGKILFSSYDFETEQYKKFLEEPYEEAKRKVFP